MNTHKKIILPVLVLALTWTIVSAQPGRQQKGDRPEWRQEKFSPDSMAMHQTKRMTEALKLTPEQQKQVENINREAARDRASMQEEMQKERDAMQEKMQAKRDVHDKALKEVLTDEQYKKFQEMHKQGPRGQYRDHHRSPHRDFHRGKPGNREDDRPPKKG